MTALLGAILNDGLINPFISGMHTWPDKFQQILSNLDSISPQPGTCIMSKMCKYKNYLFFSEGYLVSKPAFTNWEQKIDNCVTFGIIFFKEDHNLLRFHHKYYNHKQLFTNESRHILYHNNKNCFAFS